MKTINQINGALRNDQTIEFYNYCSSDKFRYSDNWRNRSFDFKFNDRIYRLSISGNFLYGAAVRQWELINNFSGHDYNRDTKRCYIDIEAGYNRKLTFEFYAKNDLDGIICRIKTNHKTGNHHYYIQSNKTWLSFDLEKYAAKYINTILYAPGLFRNIQVVYNCLKSEVPEIYKKILADGKKEQAQDFDHIIYRYFRKQFNRLNIDVSEIWNHKQLIQAWTKFKDCQPFKKRKLLQVFNPFEMYDRLICEHDTEDGLMSAAEDEIYDNNIIWI